MNAAQRIERVRARLGEFTAAYDVFLWAIANDLIARETGVSNVDQASALAEEYAIKYADVFTRTVFEHIKHKAEADTRVKGRKL